MKTLLLALLALTTNYSAQAAEMDYVAYSLNHDATKALRRVYPFCGRPIVTATQEEGLTKFEVVQKCKTSKSVGDDTANKSVTIGISGVSAPWGELDNVEVKVGPFCAGNCEVL